MATPVDRVQNPFVREQPAYTQDISGRLRYLGHSSTWSFSRQVLQLVHEHTPVSNPSYGEKGEAYNLEWEPLGVVNFTGLPSREVSLYVLQTVKLRTSPLFHLFDERDFTGNLDKLYQDPAIYAQTAKVWFVHYLWFSAISMTMFMRERSRRERPGLFQAQP